MFHLLLKYIYLLQFLLDFHVHLIFYIKEEVFQQYIKSEKWLFKNNSVMQISNKLNIT